MPARLPDVPEEVARDLVASVVNWSGDVRDVSATRAVLGQVLEREVQTYGLSAVARAIGWPRQRLHAFIGKGDRT